jgi:hypothetical protein
MEQFFDFLASSKMIVQLFKDFSSLFELSRRECTIRFHDFAKQNSYSVIGCHITTSVHFASEGKEKAVAAL